MQLLKMNKETGLETKTVQSGKNPVLEKGTSYDTTLQGGSHVKTQEIETDREEAEFFVVTSSSFCTSLPHISPNYFAPRRRLKTPKFLPLSPLFLDIPVN